jgi:hypothetical protein
MDLYYLCIPRTEKLRELPKKGPKRREAARVLTLTASRGVSSKWY